MRFLERVSLAVRVEKNHKTAHENYARPNGLAFFMMQFNS